jgi:hypothetical protein
MVRIKEVQAGGQSFRIANLQLGPERRWAEALAAIQEGKAHPATVYAERDAMMLACLQRADPAFDVKRLEQLDADDVEGLLREIATWSRPQGAPPAGETPSP